MVYIGGKISDCVVNYWVRNQMVIYIRRKKTVRAVNQ